MKLEQKQQQTQMKHYLRQLDKYEKAEKDQREEYRELIQEKNFFASEVRDLYYDILQIALRTCTFVWPSCVSINEATSVLCSGVLHVSRAIRAISAGVLGHLVLFGDCSLTPRLTPLCFPHQSITPHSITLRSVVVNEMLKLLTSIPLVLVENHRKKNDKETNEEKAPQIMTLPITLLSSPRVRREVLLDCVAGTRISRARLLSSGIVPETHQVHLLQAQDEVAVVSAPVNASEAILAEIALRSIESHHFAPEIRSSFSLDSLQPQVDIVYISQRNIEKMRQKQHHAEFPMDLTHISKESGSLRGIHAGTEAYLLLASQIDRLFGLWQQQQLQPNIVSDQDIDFENELQGIEEQDILSTISDDLSQFVGLITEEDGSSSLYSLQVVETECNEEDSDYLQHIDIPNVPLRLKSKMNQIRNRNVQKSRDLSLDQLYYDLENKETSQSTRFSETLRRFLWKVTSDSEMKKLGVNFDAKS